MELRWYKYHCAKSFCGEVLCRQFKRSPRGALGTLPFSSVSSEAVKQKGTRIRKITRSLACRAQQPDPALPLLHSCRRRYAVFIIEVTIVRSSAVRRF